MTTLVHPAVVEYLAGLSRLPHPHLDVVAREGRAEGLPIVFPETGALLHALVRLTGARRVLEIGTAIGYSALWMATALPADGQLISLERHPGRAARARAHAAEAGVGDRVHVMMGDASRFLHKIAGPFDVTSRMATRQVTERASNAHDHQASEHRRKMGECRRGHEGVNPVKCNAISVPSSPPDCQERWSAPALRHAASVCIRQALTGALRVAVPSPHTHNAGDD